MKLHKLSNGNWIDLSTVTAVIILPRSQCWPGGPIHPVRIVVHAGHFSGQGIEILPCDDDIQAIGIAEELAELVNQCKPI